MKYASVCCIANISNNNNNSSWYLSNLYYTPDSILTLHVFTHSTLIYDINLLSSHPINYNSETQSNKVSVLRPQI